MSEKKTRISQNETDAARRALRINVLQRLMDEAPGGTYDLEAAISALDVIDGISGREAVATAKLMGLS